MGCGIDIVCGLLQPVDLMVELRRRGLETHEAEQYLDSGPELTFAVWCVNPCS